MRTTEHGMEDGSIRESTDICTQHACCVVPQDSKAKIYNRTHSLLNMPKQSTHQRTHFTTHTVTGSMSITMET